MQVQLRDALGDSVEWIRDWSEDGSQSPGSLRMLFQLVHRTRHKYHNITRISQEIKKYRFQIQEYPDGKHLANMSLDVLADGLSACSNTVCHHLLCWLAGQSACPILGSQVFNFFPALFVPSLPTVVFIFQNCSVLSLGACVVRFRDRRQAEAWIALRGRVFEMCTM